MRIRTSDLRFPRFDALPLSHRDSTVSEVYYEGLRFRPQIPRQSVESEGLGFDSSWGLILFQLGLMRLIRPLAVLANMPRTVK